MPFVVVPHNLCGTVELASEKSWVSTHTEESVRDQRVEMEIAFQMHTAKLSRMRIGAKQRGACHSCDPRSAAHRFAVV